jgi:hypothetical protein
MIRFHALALCFQVLAFSCSRLDDPPTIDLVIEPEGRLLLAPGQTVQLRANAPVRWQANGGVIDQDGKYTASDTAGIYKIRAASVADARVSLEKAVLTTPHAPLFQEMRSGGFVVYFRHMLAREGTDRFELTEPGWWTRCDTAVARQLSPDGREHARQIGQAFKNLELPVGKIISSEFCRCVESAELLDLGLPIERSSDITFIIYGEETRYERTMRLAGELSLGDKLVILMSHSFPLNSPGPGLNQGDAAVYWQENIGNVNLETIISLQDWIALGLQAVE